MLCKHTAWGGYIFTGHKGFGCRESESGSLFLLHHGQPLGCRAALQTAHLDQPRLDTEVLSSICGGGFIMKRTCPLWVATPTGSPLVPIRSFLTRLFSRVCLCRATRWNNKPGEVSFICSARVYTAHSLPLLSRWLRMLDHSPACSLALSSSFIHSLSLLFLDCWVGLPPPPFWV